MIRRYGAPPDPGRRWTLRPGVYAILPRDGALLLTHQSEPSPEYQLPGGGVDPGEHPIAALHREVFEETGWRIGPPRRLGAFRRFTYMPEYDLWAEKLCTIYLAHPVRRMAPPSEPGHRACWMPVDEAAQVLGNPGDAAFVTSGAVTALRR
ncbi:NUDIX hydrolase [Citreimonas sp.]|uniref:NUDIX hydrolase n=1 Tax=Citreimonas sp. TaxID=3036715 RepID=UPI0035C83338